MGDEAIYDESQVPSYALPDPLTFDDGSRVRLAEDWTGRRRDEIVALFEQHVYGRVPENTIRFQPRTDTVVPNAVDGKAIRKLVTLAPERTRSDAGQHDAEPSAGGPRSRESNRVEPSDGEPSDGEPQIQLLIYFPKSASPASPVPLFVGLNFQGNHTVDVDPAIPLTKSWVRAHGDAKGNQATDDMRGAAASRWPVEQIIDRGYGLVTAYYGDIDPDFDDGFENGVHALFPKRTTGKAAADGSQWGSIATWAWGLSRIMDYIERDSVLDSTRVAVMGHSRLGKTALWAGALDERFALTVSNNSGCGGAALSRRRFGESVRRINTSFPHWFCDNFSEYNDNEDACPVDQHMLIALIGPRPVLICSAEDDRWADPRGEFLSGLNAATTYRLLGTDGLAVTEMPDLNHPVMSRIGYHIRPGKHDVLPTDWGVYVDFADKHLRQPESP